MFDIGFMELVLVGIVALLVLGPERLPHAARMAGAFLGRITRSVQSIREEVEREVNIFEMQQRIKKQVEDGMIGDIKKELAEARDTIQEGFNSVARNEQPALPPTNQPPLPAPSAVPETTPPEITPADISTPRKETP